MDDGTQIGAYRIVRQIAEGGMGSVWLAEHTLLGRLTAIKLLHPELSVRAEIVQRFFNEARATAAIGDPGIVQIFDFGMHTDGSAYLAMELLEGETLSARIRRDGAIRAGDALRIVRQVASSVGAAHTRGIVHRDLKPDNIFLVRDPEVAGGERTKILDFGIAKLVDPTRPKTETSAVMGTPTFMSPEQCRGAGLVDLRSDIYSLGCVIFLAVTGRPPFDAPGSGDVLAMHLREPAPLLSRYATGAPPELEALVARCLEKDPDRRFASGQDLAVAIENILGRPSIASLSRLTVVEAPGAAHADVPTTLSAAAQQVGGPRTGSRRRVVAIAAAVVAASAGIGWIVNRGSRTAEPAPEIAVAPVVAAVPTPASTPAPSPPPAPPPPPAPVIDHRVQLVTDQIRAAAIEFDSWSKAHAGAPCPTAAAIGATDDPWGHPLVVTCTDQPADQIVGILSAGADGKLGTDDDLASWTLGRDISNLVRGARWHVAPPKREPIKRPPPKPHATTPEPNHDDGIPSER